MAKVLVIADIETKVYSKAARSNYYQAKAIGAETAVVAIGNNIASASFGR